MFHYSCRNKAVEMYWKVNEIELKTDQIENGTKDLVVMLNIIVTAVRCCCKDEFENVDAIVV